MNNDIIEQVIKLTKSNNIEIREAANATLSLYYQHNNNEISDEEFDELLKDIISVFDIQNNMNEIEYYRMANQTLKALLTIKSLTGL